MNSIKLIPAVVCLAIFFGSCDINDDIYNTPHPRHGTLTLTADWSDMGADISRPATCTVAVDGYTAESSTADTGWTLDHLFVPGSYTAYVYNKVEALPVTISGSSATAEVQTVPTPPQFTGPFVAPLPGWLFTGRVDATLAADTEHAFTVPMRQQVRQLTLVITPGGSSAHRIEGITAALWGVAGTLEAGTDTHAAPSSVLLDFVQSDVPEDDNWYATVRLLGITGSEQLLTGTVSFTDGLPADMPLRGELSGVLSGFNADKKTPLTLGGHSVETPSGTGITASITDWVPVPGSGTAN